MNRSIEKLTAMICVVIFFSACASYAQSEYWDGSGYSGTGLDSNENYMPDNSKPDSGVGGDSWESQTSAESAEVSEPSEGAYFPISVSESSSRLVDETTSNQYNRVNSVSDSAVSGFNYLVGGAGTSKNIFWIVSKDGTMHWRSVNIPCHRYARLLIIPSSSGQLIMEERYPNSQVRSYNFGNVRAYNQYRMWFFADTSGTHKLRYRIDNGPYSDILTFHVGCCGGADGCDDGGRCGQRCPCCGQLIKC
jgi:hypothetical protein